MKVITIPKTPKSAYDPGRPASDLLRAQVAHLETAAGIAPADARNRRGLRTEGQVASYIAQLTRALTPQLNAPPGVRLEAPTAPSSVPRGKPRRRSKAASPVRKAAARGRSTIASSLRTPKPSRARSRKAR